MSGHTKEPWRVRDESEKGFGVWVDAPEAMVSNPGGRSYPRQILEDEEYPEKLADARRIVACVNACAGVPTEILQSWLNPPDGQMGLPHGPWHRHLVALGAERAELLAALEGVLPFLTGSWWPGIAADAAIDRAIAIVRKAEGVLPEPARRA